LDEACAARMARLNDRGQAKAAKLRELAAQALAVLRRHPAEASFRALTALSGSTGVDYDEYGTTMEEAPASEVFATADALSRAVQDGSYCAPRCRRPSEATRAPPLHARPRRPRGARRSRHR
jgi:hypothetical protein